MIVYIPLTLLPARSDVRLIDLFPVAIGAVPVYATLEELRQVHGDIPYTTLRISDE